MALLFSVTTLVVRSQNRINYFPDSVRLELPDEHTLIVFELKTIQKDSLVIKNFPSMMKEFLEYMKKSTPSNFSETGPYRINIKMQPEGFKEIISNSEEHAYKPMGERTIMSIRKIDELQTQVILKEKQIAELLPPGWEVFIVSENFKIKVYSESFAGLTAVANEDFTQASSIILNDSGMKVIGKKSVRARVVLQQKNISQSSVEYKYPGDNIGLNVNAGIGLFRDKLYPELSFKLALTFKDHFSRHNLRASLIYNNLFFAEKATEGYTTNLNTFLSVSFEKNFNKKYDRPQWSGLGIGFLTIKNGDYFSGKTAKFFITHEMGNRVNIVPEFYLTNDFTKFALGITLKYSF